MAYGSSQSFNEMINENLSYELLKNEFLKDDFILNAFEVKEGWVPGQSLIVPFKEASASSVVFGGLEDEDDIGESVLVRGKVEDYKLVTSSMVFNHRDLVDHSGSSRISKKTFLKLLPDEIEDHIRVLRDQLAHNILNGKKVAKVVSVVNAATGVLELDRPDRLSIGMKVEINDAVSSATITAYVGGIDIPQKQMTLVTARGGATAQNLTALNLTNETWLNLPGANDKAFMSLKESLLPSSLGGVDSLYGKSKASYSYLQSHYTDGSSITATSILTKIFDTYTEQVTFYKGKPSEVWMSFKNFGTCMKEVEKSKGAYNVVAGSRKTTLWGYDQAEIVGVGGGVLKLVGIRAMDNDFMVLVDRKGAKFHTDSFIRRIKSPDGNEYFVKRAAGANGGYKYILDHELFGEFVVDCPQKFAVIHSIDY